MTCDWNGEGRDEIGIFTGTATLWTLQLEDNDKHIWGSMPAHSNTLNLNCCLGVVGGVSSSSPGDIDNGVPCFNILHPGCI